MKLLILNSVLNKNEGGSFPLCKKCTLVVANKTTLLHGKDNTFRSGHPEVAERFDQILGKGHRDRYVSSLFRVNVPVPMILQF